VWANYPDGTFEAWTHNKQGKVLEHRHRNGQVDRYDYVPFADDGLNCAIYDVLRGYRP
jgi:YD repeat-containing protein